MSDATAAAATTTDTAAAPATTDTTTTTADTAATSTSTDAAATTTATTKAAATTDEAGKTAAGDGKPKEGEDAPTGVPEKYKLAPPEGFELEPETTAAFEGVARELNLTNDQANKLVPLGAQLVAKVQAQQAEVHQQQVTKWADEAKADKEYGGEKFDASLAVALKARDRFATPELKTLMDQTGLGNHPEMVRLFHRIGTAIADDSFVQAPAADGAQKSAASVLFDHPSSQLKR